MWKEVHACTLPERNQQSLPYPCATQTSYSFQRRQETAKGSPYRVHVIAAATQQLLHCIQEEALRLQETIQEKRHLLSAAKARLAKLRSQCARTTHPRSHGSDTSTCDVPPNHAAQTPPTPTTSNPHSNPSSSRSSGPLLPNRRVPHGSHTPLSFVDTTSPVRRDLPPTVAEHTRRAQHTPAGASDSAAAPLAAAGAPPRVAPNGRSTHVVPRHAAPTLHNMASAFPPRISSFRTVAGISYADLKECSGSAGRGIDFTHTSLPDLIRRVRAEKAAREGCGVGEVCFFLQLHWDAAPGLPLSMSSTLSTPECVASSVLMYLAADLEALLRACRTGTIGATLSVAAPQLDQSQQMQPLQCVHCIRAPCHGTLKAFGTGSQHRSRQLVS